jgi:hypothetical protein
LQELTLAAGMPDGYERRFELPSAIQGLSYAIVLHPEMAPARDWLTINVGGADSLLFLDTDTVGTIGPGTNILRKTAGVSMLNLAMPSPILRYPFTGGTANDTSGNGLSGALFGPVSVAGYRGPGMQFDGINDYIETPHNALLAITGDITITAWIRVNSYLAGNSIIATKQAVGGNAPYQFVLTGAGRLRLSQQSGAGSTVGSTAVVPIGSWQHVAVVRSGGQVWFYLNGQPVGGPLTLTSGAADAGAPLRIGYHNANNRPFNGTMDEIRIYNSALNQTQIQADATI